MKHVKKFMLLTVMLLALTVPAVSYASEANEEPASIQQYVNDMQPGWNLGNTFDAVGADETAWGNPRVTQQFIENLAEQGFKSIRIPVTFDQRMSTASDYTIDEQFLSRLDQAIQWSLDEGLYVMINVHHDSWIWLESGMQQNHDESLARFEAIWTQLADRYKDYTTKLMFESINEPRFWGSEEEKQTYLDELNAAFYNIVRNAGGHNAVRPIVLPTLDTGSEQHKIDALYDFIEELDDPNVIATIHYYGFWPFSVNIAGVTTFNEETKNDVITTFNKAYDNFVAKGIPVVIGEFGLLGFDTDLYAIQQGEKLKFFEFMIHYAQEKQLTHMLWDNGQHFGRQSYQWSDQELYDMMKASWAGRSATAETDSVFIKRNRAIEDVEIELQLHGNQFNALTHQGKALIANEDYVLNSSVLTLKASLLEELTSQGELGRNAELMIEFNKGKKWSLFIVTYDTPVLGSASGTTEQFHIPVAYNGDQLATMEALYEDGSNAGPQNWTSFKEFAYTFKPDYANNTLTLTSNFFNEVNDGNVKLKLHFWSGELLEYTITKNGAAVTSSITPPYHDIVSHWGFAGVTRAAELGIVTGNTDGSFHPDQALSRADLAVMIGRALQLPADTTNEAWFADEASIPAYAKSFIAQLAELQIINGYTDNSFRPKQHVTRAELAVIIARALKLDGPAASSYPDQASIPSWAQNEIALVADLKLMNGKANGHFDAAASTTRAEAAIVMVRVVDYLAEARNQQDAQQY